MTPDQPPPPFRSRQEVRQLVIANLIRLRAYGRGPDGDADVYLDLDGKPWTTLEVSEAFGYAIGLFLQLASEADAAAAEGRSTDVAALLEREALEVAIGPDGGPFPGVYVDDPDTSHGDGGLRIVRDSPPEERDDGTDQG